MRTFAISDIDPARLEDYRAIAVTVDHDAGVLTIDTGDKAWRVLVRRHLNTPTLPADFKAGERPEPAKPVERDKWPWLARVVAWLRTDGEKGIGDTAARVFATVGAKDLAEMYTWIRGKDCKCSDRQQRLNEMYGYALR